MSSITDYYNQAKEKYKELDINTDEAVDRLKAVGFSLKCCDVIDVESRAETSDYKSELGNSPKLRHSMEKAFRLIPGKHRISLNAVHMDADEYVEMDEIEACHYDLWVTWAKKHTAGMDFYTSMTKHEKSDAGFALSDRNKDIRYFWVEHCQRCRIVGQYIGQELGTPCVTTININDFFENIPTESVSTQGFLVDSLKKVYSESINKNYNQDSVFTGLGEMADGRTPVIDSSFCTNYSISNDLYASVDTRDAQKEKQINRKLGSVVSLTDKVIVYIQPERDSDNKIVLNDKLKNLARYIVHNDLLSKAGICLDFKTSASDLAKIKKWVLGTRAVQKAFLLALLEPVEYLKRCDDTRDYNSRDAIKEEVNTYPFGAVWDYFCLMMDTPVGLEWLGEGHHMDS